MRAPTSQVGKTGLALTDSNPSECKRFKGLVKPGAAPLRLLLPPIAVNNHEGAALQPLPRLHSGKGTAGDSSGINGINSINSKLSHRVDQPHSGARKMSSIMESVEEEEGVKEEEGGVDAEAPYEAISSTATALPNLGAVSGLPTTGSAAKAAETAATVGGESDASNVMASEVELLQVMSTPSLRFSGRLSSSFSSPLGKTSNKQASSAGEAAMRKLAWRGHLRPALDRNSNWVAFHGRPNGQQQQVLVTYLGDPDQLWLLGVQY